MKPKNSSSTTITASLRLLLTILLLSWVGYGVALPSDKDQPVHINNADTMDADNASGIVTYKGKDISVSQGSLQITQAQWVKLYRDQSGQLIKAVAGGQPVYFQQRPALGKPLITGHALTIEYLIDKDSIRLIKQAYVKQNQDILSAEQIDYAIGKQLIRASKGDDNQARVETIIQPHTSQ
jgi:lipopolysaccharide export system protein LptA